MLLARRTAGDERIGVGEIAHMRRVVARVLNAVRVRWCYGATSRSFLEAFAKTNCAYSRRASQDCRLRWIKQWLCRFPERPSSQRSACARKTYVSSRCSAGRR
jgi:hypothetical protein